MPGFHCLNGGTCSNTDGSFTCSCQVGYTGDTCDSDIDECNDIPCHNEVSCMNNNGSFICICPGGFTGEVCEMDIDNVAISLVKMKVHV